MEDEIEEVLEGELEEGSFACHKIKSGAARKPRRIRRSAIRSIVQLIFMAAQNFVRSEGQEPQS
jgi:hypothetical protein